MHRVIAAAPIEDASRSPSGNFRKKRSEHQRFDVAFLSYPGNAQISLVNGRDFQTYCGNYDAITALKPEVFRDFVPLGILRDKIAA